MKGGEKMKKAVFTLAIVLGLSFVTATASHLAYDPEPYSVTTQVAYDPEPYVMTTQA